MSKISHLSKRTTTPVLLVILMTALVVAFFMVKDLLLLASLDSRKVGYYTCDGKRWGSSECENYCNKKSCWNLDKCKSCLASTCKHSCSKRCKIHYTGDTVQCGR